jgi:molecular chaperone DnaK
MTREGELNAEEDKRRKEEIEIKNRADSMIYSVEKLLKENRETISEDDAKSIEAALEEAKKTVADGDTGKINTAIENLTSSSHKLAEAMYKQASTSKAAAEAGAGAAGAGAAEPNAGGKGEGQVIDAEVVDDDKKQS